jgi:hypothetical protein
VAGHSHRGVNSAGGAHATIEARAIAIVAIAKQKSRWCSVPGAFHDLLCSPVRCRMPCHFKGPTGGGDLLIKQGVVIRRAEAGTVRSQPDSGRRRHGGGQQLTPSSWFGAQADSSFQVLWEDGDRVICRGASPIDGHRTTCRAQKTDMLLSNPINVVQRRTAWSSLSKRAVRVATDYSR